MVTFTIKVDSIENVRFIEELLQKFQFVKEIEISKRNTNLMLEGYKNLPIRLAKLKPDVSFAVSIIKNRILSIDEILKNSWKWNW